MASTILMAAFLGFVLIQQIAGQSSLTSSLVERLLRAENVIVRPNADNNQPMNVSIGLTLTDLEEDSTRTDVFKIQGFVQLKWQNSRLTWTPSDYGNIKQVAIPSNLVWTPDITLYNSQDAAKRVFSEEPKLVLVESDGTVLWITPATLPIRCKTTTANKDTFGEISCKIKLGSWVYNGFQLDVQPWDSKIDTSFFSEDYFRITETSIVRIEAQYPCCPEPYPSIQMNFTASRIK